MKMMHLISGGDVGGAKTQVLTMLQELGRKHETDLVCFMEGVFAQEAREMGIPTTVLEGQSPVKLLRLLRSRLEGGNYDILHCHGSKANLFGTLLRGKLGIPVVSTIHSDPKLDYLGRPLANLTYGTVNRLALRRRDAWVAVSDAMKEILIRDGLDADRIHVIYNGISFSQKLEHMPRRDYLRQQGLDWDEEYVIFGIAARLNPVKDVKTLIRAFAQAAKVCPRIGLLIAGDGEQRQELEAMAAQLCPEGSVRFVGWQSDMNSFYHSLNVNVLCSISETFPYAITEGARMSCATIATAVGGIPKVVIDNKTGFLVEPGDWNTMSQRMIALARDAKLRSRLGQAIYQKVRTEFSAEVMAARQVEIYENVIYREFRRREGSGRYDAVICGAYGRGNVGDDAILQTIIRQLRQQDPFVPICVMTRKPTQTALATGVSTTPIFHVFRAARHMKASALYISGGGTLLQNATSTRSLLYYLFSIYQAKKCGCRVMLYGCGAGPIRGMRCRRLAAKVLNRYTDELTLRDPESDKTLRAYGVSIPTMTVTADPALAMQAEQEGGDRFLRANGVEPEQDFCLFVLRPWLDMDQRLDAIRSAAEYMWHQYGLKPLFLCFEPARDLGITRRAVQGLSVPYGLLEGEADGGVMCGVIARAKLVVGMRLHALVFACSQDTPMVGISYDPKVSGFLSYLGSDHWIDLNALSADGLCQVVDRALKDGAPDSAGRLKLLAEENGRIAGRLLRSDSPNA